MRAILGLVQTSPGTVTVLGGPAGSANREIGYLPQRHGYDSMLPVRGVDLVRLGLDDARWGLPAPFGLARGVGVARGDYASQWPGRLCIAMASHAHARARDEGSRARVINLVGATAYAERTLGVSEHEIVLHGACEDCAA